MFFFKKQYLQYRFYYKYYYRNSSYYIIITIKSYQPNSHNYSIDLTKVYVFHKKNSKNQTRREYFEEYLKNLSLKRARNVSDYLVAKGVRVSMRYEGFGAVTKDIGTSVQRKVELRWLDDSDKTAYVQKCVTP